jgi:hypothetical protein
MDWNVTNTTSTLSFSSKGKKLWGEKLKFCPEDVFKYTSSVGRET